MRLMACLDVRFKQYGLTSIEVVDNGSGIAEKDHDSIGMLCCGLAVDVELIFGFRSETSHFQVSYVHGPRRTTNVWFSWRSFIFFMCLVSVGSSHDIDPFSCRSLFGSGC